MARRVQDDEEEYADSGTRPAGSGAPPVTTGTGTGDTRPATTMVNPTGQTAMPGSDYGRNPPAPGPAAFGAQYDPNRSNFNTPGGQARSDRLNAAVDAYGNRVAPQAGDSAFRDYQTSLADRLQRQMSGQDSMAAMQLRQATDANIAQQRAMAASAGPGAQALAQRQAMQQAGQMNQGFAQQAGMLGIQERNAAANALAGLTGQARGQDLSLNQFNVGAQLQGRGLNDQAQAQARAQELANAGLMQQGNMGWEANQTSRYGMDTQRYGMDLNAQVQREQMEANKPEEPEWWETALDVTTAIAPAAIMAASDERLKTNIGKPSGQYLDRMIGSMDPKSYEYKDKGFGEGQRIGPMAQDIERGGGGHMVHDTSAGKMLDVPKSLTTALGLIGRLGKRIDSLEGKKPRYMAEGGIVDEPTDVVVGEEGPEAIVPLGTNKGMQKANAKRAGLDLQMPTLDEAAKEAVPEAVKKEAKPDWKVQALDNLSASQSKKPGKVAKIANSAATIGSSILKAIAAGKAGAAAKVDPEAPIDFSVETELAEGGVVTQPTRALVGERGPEAIVPLSGLRQPGPVGKMAAPGAGIRNDEELNRLGTGAQRLRGERNLMQPAQAMGGRLNGIGTSPSGPFRPGGMARPQAVAGLPPPWAQQAAQMGAAGAMGGRPVPAPNPTAAAAAMGGMRPPMAQPMPRPAGPPPNWGAAAGALGGATAFMADGGIVDRPTRTILGESGPEAVIPLDKLPELVDQLAARTKQTGRKSTGEGKPPPPEAVARLPGLIDRLAGRVASDDAVATGFGRIGRSAGAREPRPKMKARAASLASGVFGPPAPAGLEGPVAPPEAQNAYRPQNQREYELFQAGVDSAAARGTPEYEEELKRDRAAQQYFGTPMPNRLKPFEGLSTAEWRAYLAGLGVK